MATKDKDQRWVIGIGGVKCATTWLSQCLREHPQIGMAPHKEIHYFSNHYNKGEEWYLNHFQKCKQGMVYGEFSTSYLYEANAAERIYDFNSEAKIIVNLRNPVMRLFSHYKHLLRSEQIPQNISVDEAIKLRSELLEYGNYGKYLARYYDCFDKRQIIVVVMENIHRNPRQILNHVYKEIGVDPSYLPSVVNKAIGTGFIPRFRWLDRARRDLFYYLRDHKQSWIINLVRRIGISEMYRKINQSPSKQRKNDIDPDFKRQVFNSYKDDIIQLRQLTGLSFEEWEE
jgi:hypothetical protein